MRDLPTQLHEIEVDIADLIAQICERLDITPDVVSQITLTPDTATITSYLLNEHGNRYVHQTGPSAGCMAVERTDRRIRT